MRRRIGFPTLFPVACMLTTLCLGRELTFEDQTEARKENEGVSSLQRFRLDLRAYRS